MAGYSDILVEEDGPVALVTLNRPGQLNSMGGTMMSDLTHSVVAYDHPHHALLEEAITIDFVNRAMGPNARVAVELTLEAAKELSGALTSGPSAAPSQAHLTESTAHLVEALHHQKDAGVLGQAKQRLIEAAARTEAEAPLAAGIIYRIIEALANVGI